MNDIFYTYLRLYPGKADDIISIMNAVENENPGVSEQELRTLTEMALCNELN